MPALGLDLCAGEKERKRPPSGLKIYFLKEKAILNIESAKLVLKAAAIAGDSVIMEGKHGIGKSQIVSQFSEEEGYHMEALFLSHQEVGDIIGSPKTYESGGVAITTWSVPIWLHRMHEAAARGVRCVLFLDELNRAPLDVRQSALQLVLEGRIHEHELPVVNGQPTVVVSAINPADEYQVDELDPALLDRFLHVTVDADAPAWLRWAREEGVNEVVLDFIAENPDRLHWEPQDLGVGATPRSWAKLGKFIDNAESTPEEILFQIMKGKVGPEVGSQFYSFWKNHSHVVKVEDVERVVSEHSEIEDIDELAGHVRELIDGMEAIQKTDLCTKLKDKYGAGKNILPFLAYLYAMDVELLVGFLKGLRKDSPKIYSNLAAIDDAVNGKKLFHRIVSAASREV